MNTLILLMLFKISSSYGDVVEYSVNMHSFWKRSILNAITLDVVFQFPTSKLNECSMRCKSDNDCGSFLLDTQNDICMGFHNYSGSNTIEISANKWYFLPFDNNFVFWYKVEEVNDLKNGLSRTITKCIPNLTISGFIGDVHLVSHGKVFNEALTCPLPQVTKRPLALQHEQYCIPLPPTTTVSPLAVPPSGCDVADTICSDVGGELSQYINSNTVVYSFTTCTKTGNRGPTLELCTTSTNSTWGNEPSYNVSSSGVQQWTVPETASYRIEACGASGGKGSGGAGGRGAKVASDFVLSSGTLLNVVCGQRGGEGASSEAGGGGGGSFVYTGALDSGQLLIAAGGGGGAGEETTHNGYNGHCGEQAICICGYCGSNITQVGGIGYGGMGGSQTTAGAGWLSDGASSSGNSGTRWNGGAQPSAGVGIGGFGGGGSGVATNGGGGGGGFTGGHGTSNTNRTHWGGSGGGSFNGGTGKTSVSGYNYGDGYVTIIRL